MRPSLVLRRAALPLALLALGACTSWRPQTAPPAEVLATPSPHPVRLTRADQSTLVLRNARVVDDSIVGEVGEPPQVVAVATRDVQRLEVKRVSALRTGGLALGTGAVVLLVAVAAATVALLTTW